MKESTALKINSVIEYSQKICASCLGVRAIKGMVFTLSLYFMFKMLFPEVIHVAFDDNLSSPRIPTNIGYPVKSILNLLALLWIFQLLIYICKSIVLFLSDSITKKWKRKGFIHIWKNTTMMAFLSIWILGILFTYQFSFGRIVNFVEYSSSPFQGVNVFMDEHETFVYRTATVSMILFILLYGHLLINEMLFEKLDKWSIRQQLTSQT